MTESAGTASGPDHFDELDHGHETTTLIVQGNVNDAADGFSGTVYYSDIADGGYHDHDYGVDTDAQDSTDNFDEVTLLRCPRLSQTSCRRIVARS